MSDSLAGLLAALRCAALRCARARGAQVRNMANGVAMHARMHAVRARCGLDADGAGLVWA